MPVIRQAQRNVDASQDPNSVREVLARVLSHESRAPPPLASHASTEAPSSDHHSLPGTDGLITPPGELPGESDEPLPTDLERPDILLTDYRPPVCEGEGLPPDVVQEFRNQEVLYLRGSQKVMVADYDHINGESSEFERQNAVAWGSF